LIGLFPIPVDILAYMYSSLLLLLSATIRSQFIVFQPTLSKLLCSSSTRVLVNGEPGDLILHKRGLRQGDPLSHMLFILVMDVLNSSPESFGTGALATSIGR
jgi:hypothetical protein